MSLDIKIHPKILSKKQRKKPPLGDSWRIGKHLKITHEGIKTELITCSDCGERPNERSASVVWFDWILLDMSHARKYCI